MTTNGNVVASIPASAVTDSIGNNNFASTSTDNTVAYVDVPPTVMINQAVGQADPTSSSPIIFAVVFSEPVTGFTAADISFAGSTVGGALVATVSGTGPTYTIGVTGMTMNGNVVASIPANVVTDSIGNNNFASTSTDNTVAYVDVPPTVTINQAVGQADPTSGSPIKFTVVFSEPVTGFTAADVSFAGSTVGGTLVATISGTGPTYTVGVTGMTTNGNVVASIPASAVTDSIGNNNFASTSTDNTVSYDVTPPTVTINQAVGQADPTSIIPINFTVVFSESVTGFVGTDVSLSGTAGATTAIVTGSGATYNVAVSGMSANGTVIVSIPVNRAQDAANNGNAVSTSTDNSVTYNLNGGPDTTGVFRPSNGLLYLKNTNTTGFADVAINYGLGGDYPVVGDWDGNDTTTIGVYRNGFFYLRNSNTLGFADLVFPFGQPGDQPIAGDWDGDGIDTIGVYRPSTGQFLLRNSNSGGRADMGFFLGSVGDIGIAGDWDGDGVDTTGVFRPSNGVIFLKNTNATGFADVALNYGLAGDQPVIGDWNADGIDTIGVYRNGIFYLRNSNTNGFAEIVFGLGNPGDMPIAGNWDGVP
jgi:hypothetical protein